MINHSFLVQQSACLVEFYKTCQVSSSTLQRHLYDSDHPETSIVHLQERTFENKLKGSKLKTHYQRLRAVWMVLGFAAVIGCLDLLLIIA